MLTKTDFIELEKRFVTKKEFHVTLQTVADQLVDLITTFRADFEAFKQEMREFRTEMRDITTNHELRLDHLEDKVIN